MSEERNIREEADLSASEANVGDTKYIKVYAYGMDVSPRVTYAEYVKTFRQINTIATISRESLSWWLGDMVIAGEKFFSEKYSQAIDMTGYSYNYLKSCVYLCKKFPLEERIYRHLTPGHYKLVVGLDRSDRHAILQLADTNSWTVSDVCKRVRGEEPVVEPIGVGLSDEAKRAASEPIRMVGVDKELVKSMELFGEWWKNYPKKALTPRREALDKLIAKDSWEMCRHLFMEGIFDEEVKEGKFSKPEKTVYNTGHKNI